MLSAKVLKPLSGMFKKRAPAWNAEPSDVFLSLGEELRNVTNISLRARERKLRDGLSDTLYKLYTLLFIVDTYPYTVK